MIRQITINDAEKICRIYNHYVFNTAITFEEEPVTKKDMSIRIEKTAAKFPWLIYEEEDDLIGYAYATEWRSRTAYRFAAETTVYLKPDSVGKGIGSLLYSSLINEMKRLPFHCLIGGIALPNNSSIALHEKMGFMKVAHFQEAGFKLGRWIDVGYWQLLLQYKG